MQNGRAMRKQNENAPLFAIETFCKHLHRNRLRSTGRFLAVLGGIPDALRALFCVSANPGECGRNTEFPQNEPKRQKSKVFDNQPLMEILMGKTSGKTKPFPFVLGGSDGTNAFQQRN